MSHLTFATLSETEGSFSLDDLRSSPSPRQANVSLSFSSMGSCPLDYSDDVSNQNSIVYPVSPVSQDDEDSDDNDDKNERPSSGSSSSGKLGRAQKAQGDEEITEIAKESHANEVANGSTMTHVKESPTTRKHSDCNKRNAQGQSALSISSSRCFLDGIKLLIEKGANVNLQDIHERTPLHLACENTTEEVHHDCVEFLLQKGASTNIQDVFGRTPLHIAAKEGCAQCIKLLLDHGASTSIKTLGGDTALHITAKMGRVDCMAALSPEVGDDTTSLGDDTISHSSVESSPSLLFDHDSVVQKDLVNSSFYTTMPDTTPYNNIKLNDSGYFTARGGSAWVKSKYYNNSDKIEEEKERSSIDSSTLSSADGKYEIESLESNGSTVNDDVDDDVRYIRWLFGCLEIIFRIVLYLLHSLLWSSSSSQANNDMSTKIKPGEDGYQFVKPPKHVAEAMEKFQRSRELSVVVNK